jgi:hypothetical protein
VDRREKETRERIDVRAHLFILGGYLEWELPVQLSSNLVKYSTDVIT